MAKKPLRLTLSQKICRRLPPVISQKVRSILYPYELARRDNYPFVVNAQTGSKLSGNAGDFHGHRFAVHGYYSWRNVAIALALVSEGDVIVEIGANIGTETVSFSDIVGATGTVHAIEPLPFNLQALSSLSELTINKNIKIYPYALSDKTQFLQFVVPPEYQTGVGYLAGGPGMLNTETIEVYCTTLDSMADQIGPSKLIYIDTEGEEVRILQGARQYIYQYRPAIFLEASPKHLGRAGFTPDDLYRELVNLGYQPYQVTRFGLHKLIPIHSYHNSNWLCLYGNQNELLRKGHRYILTCALLPCIPGLNPLTRV